VSLTSSPVRVLAISSNDCNVILAGTDSGAFRSTDGGRSWIATQSFDAVHHLAFDPADPMTVYGGHYLMLKSTNGGASWKYSHRESGGEITALVVTPGNPSVIHRAISGSYIRANFLEKSSDGGQTWQTEGDGLTNSTILSIAVDPASPS